MTWVCNGWFCGAYLVEEVHPSLSLQSQVYCEWSFAIFSFSFSYIVQALWPLFQCGQGVETVTSLDATHTFHLLVFLVIEPEPNVMLR